MQMLGSRPLPEAWWIFEGHATAGPFWYSKVVLPLEPCHSELFELPLGAMVTSEPRLLMSYIWIHGPTTAPGSVLVSMACGATKATQMSEVYATSCGQVCVQGTCF